MARQVLGERKRCFWGQRGQNHSAGVCFLWMLYSSRRGCIKNSYIGCNCNLVLFVIFLFHLVYFQLSIPRLFLRNQGDKDLLPEVCLGRDAAAEPHPQSSQGESILSSSADLSYLSPYSEHEGATFPLCFDRRKEEK